MKGDKNIYTNISKKQARDLAQYFYKDISEYVNKNRVRYEEFIKLMDKKGEKL